MRSHLLRLIDHHRTLDRAIAAASRKPLPSADLSRLKRLKLRIRDRIAAFEAMRNRSPA